MSNRYCCLLASGNVPASKQSEVKLFHEEDARSNNPHNKICPTFTTNLEILNIQNSLGDSEHWTDRRTKALHTVTDCPHGTSLRSASANTVQLSNWGQGTSASIYGWESICLHHSHFHYLREKPRQTVAIIGTIACRCNELHSHLIPLIYQGGGCPLRTPEGDFLWSCRNYNN